MKIKIAALLLLLTATVASAQDNQLIWINSHAVKLSPDSVSGARDLKFLSAEVKGKTMVGLGEASHGTHEFYLQKGRIIRFLVSKENFRGLAIEFPDSLIQPINRYVQSGEGSLRELMRPLALYATTEIFDLFQWIREFNARQPAGKRVTVMGADRPEYWSDPFTRDKYMAENILRFHRSADRKIIVWAHNVHIAKDTTMAKVPALGYHLRQQLGRHLYVMGFDTFRGSVHVLNNGVFEMHDFEGKENTYSAIFARAKADAFFLSFPEKGHPFSDTEGLITNINSNWRQDPVPLPVRLGVDFDGIIFIRNTTASRSMAVAGF